MTRAIELGFPQSEIHQAAMTYQREVESGERVVVGVNAYTEVEEHPVKVLKIKGEVERRQIQSLKERRKRRNAKKTASALDLLTRAAAANDYLMPLVLEAVRTEATIGEICDVFRKVYGEYRETCSL